MVNRKATRYILMIVILSYMVYILTACMPTSVTNDIAATTEKQLEPLPVVKETLSQEVIPTGTSVGNNHIGEKATPPYSMLPTDDLDKAKIADEIDLPATPTVTQETEPSIIYSTVSEKEATRNLVRLLDNNGVCDLPCWWGIIPGQTPIEYIGEDFVSKGFTLYKATEDDERVGLASESEQYIGQVTINGNHDIVETLEVWGGTTELTEDQNEAWSNYSIPEILKHYGRPDTVLVYHPYRFDRGVPPVYHLLMFYEDLGFEIDYLGPVEYLDDPSLVRACPNITETNVINLFLYQPEKISNVVQHVFPRNSVSFTVPGEDIYDAISWEGATGLSLNDFYDLFTSDEESTPCFDFQTYWLQ